MSYQQFGAIVKEVARISQQKNPKNYIVIQTVDSGETQYSSCIDIRAFFTSKDGSVRPTQHGVRIYRDIAVDVAAAILSALSQDELECCLEKVARMDLPQNQRQ